MRPNCGKNFGPFFLERKKKKSTELMTMIAY